MVRPARFELATYGFVGIAFELPDFLFFQYVAVLTENVDSTFFPILANFSRFWTGFLTQILTRL
jgi:hypothetical protein